MKTITIRVSQPVYEEFRRASKRQGRPTSELIREAIESYRPEWLHPRGDLRSLHPLSLGKVLKPLTRQEDLLTEMIESGA